MSILADRLRQHSREAAELADAVEEFERRRDKMMVEGTMEQNRLASAGCNRCGSPLEVICGVPGAVRFRPACGCWSNGVVMYARASDSGQQ